MTTITGFPSRRVSIIFRDEEIFECHLNRDLADERLEQHIESDTEQDHHWSLTSFVLFSDATHG